MVASYHFSVQIISRSRGQSAIAAAAYRAGERFRNERSAELHDYRRRRGVVYTDILAPTGAAPFLLNRERLWNYVEQLEGRRDAQLAREINLALPHELDANDRRKLLLNFAQEAFVSHGMVADIAIHAPVLEKGDHPHNHHAHILLTLRQATPLGLRRVKTREWNSDSLLQSWRTLWARHQNSALERAGVSARVDHRTLGAQRADAIVQQDLRQAAALDREPEIHLGRSQRKLAEVGYRANKPQAIRSERNAAILLKNADRAQRRLDAWQKAYLRSLHRPKRKAEFTGSTKKRGYRERPMLEQLLRAASLPIGQLHRIGAGLSIWRAILALRTARHSDFRQRYLVQTLALELVRDVGRQRVRKRDLNTPLIPQRPPAPLKPVTHLPRQDGIPEHSRRPSSRPPSGRLTA
jgi:hypothetical protein